MAEPVKKAKTGTVGMVKKATSYKSQSTVRAMGTPREARVSNPSSNAANKATSYKSQSTVRAMGTPREAKISNPVARGATVVRQTKKVEKAPQGRVVEKMVRMERPLRGTYGIKPSQASLKSAPTKTTTKKSTTAKRV